MNDSHGSNDSDDLSAFAPEFDSATTSRDVRDATPTRAERSDEDWLSVFTKERHPDAASIAQADDPLDDDLNQFPSDPYLDHAPENEDPFLDQFPQQAAVPQPAPAVIAHAHAQPQPWAGPWAAALVAVVICALLGTRSLHPAWWNAGFEDAPTVRSSDREASAVTSTSASAALPPALRFATPTVRTGIPSRTLRRFGAVAISVPNLASASARAPRNMPGRAPGASARATVSAQRVDRLPAVATVPLAQVVAPSRSGEDFLGEAPRTQLRPDAVLASLTRANVAEAATQEHAVRRTLQSYEKAYEELDVAATAAVWPSVDRRALARAFDTLKFQGLDFKTCAITVTDGSAIARCRGTLQIVRKVGNSMPLTAEQQWVFTMRRLGTDWKIDNVAASQATGLVAPRPHTQG